MRHTQPDQPLFEDEDGVTRFQPNAIVNYLLSWTRARGLGLNELAEMDFPIADREQLAQLIGYSWDGFQDLSYVRDSTISRIAEKAK